MKKITMLMAIASLSLLAGCGKSSVVPGPTVPSDTSDTGPTDTTPTACHENCTWLAAVEEINGWYDAKGLAHVELPHFGDGAQELTVDTSLENGDLDYVLVYGTGNFLEDYVAALAAAGWDVPAEPDEMYGYECTDATGTIEVDVDYASDDNETYFYVYSVDDLNSSGDDDGDDYDYLSTWAEVQAYVAEWSEYAELTVPTLPQFGQDGEKAYKLYYIIGWYDFLGVPDFVSVEVAGNYVTSYGESLVSNGWTFVTEEDGDYLYADSSATVLADVSYSEETGASSLYIWNLAQYTGEAGDDLFEYGYSDSFAELQGYFEVWCEAKNLEAFTLPTIADGEPGSGKFYYQYYTNYSNYFDAFSIVVGGDLTAEYTAALEAAGWNVPTEAGEYGYECIDSTLTFELDVDYDTEKDETYLTVYSYFDLYY